MYRTHARTFDRLQGGLQVVQVVVEEFLCDDGSVEWPGVQHGAAVVQLLGRVRLLEQLLRDLSKVVDETDRRVFLQRIVNAKTHFY